MKCEDKLTYEEAHFFLSYDKDTGIFTRKVSISNAQKAGVIVGCISKANGYMRISVKNMAFHSHRLAWLMSFGEWPKFVIDHINGVRHDNRLCNLRHITQQANTMNRKVRVPSLHKASGLWRVRTTFNGKEKCSYFKTIAEANLACNELQEKFRSDELAAFRADKQTEIDA